MRTVLQMDNVNELRKLSDWAIVELNIDNNPLCKTYASKQRYIRYSLQLPDWPA